MMGSNGFFVEKRGTNEQEEGPGTDIKPARARTKERVGGSGHVFDQGFWSIANG